MKKYSLLFAAAAAAFVTACGPQAFVMDIELRQPSPSGIELAGKSMSVVYMDGLSGRDTLFTKGVAEGFAKGLESEYFGGEESVNIYRMAKDAGGVYSAKDTLVNLVMDSGDDVVFLVDSPDFGNISLSKRQIVAGKGADSTNLVYATLPFRLNYYVYDSMDKADTVRIFRGSSSVRQPVFCRADDTDEFLKEKFWHEKELFNHGEFVGRKSAASFVSDWKEESFVFLYYDTAGWTKAATAAYEYRWHDAIEQWMKLLDTGNMEKRSCAEYNIASACYLLGDYELALKWLDQSDSDRPVSTSKNLRKLITAKIK